jgi:hypothetical protein
VKKGLFIVKILLMPIVVLILSGYNKMHPLKMAYTAVKYNSTKQVFEIGHRVFQDDFEATLIERYYYNGQDVFKYQKEQSAKEVVNAFFEKNFRFSVNDQPLKVKFQRVEQKYDMGVIVWYETAKVNTDTVKSVQVYNSIMMESFKEQVNMFNLNINDKIRRTIKFDYHKTYDEIFF